MTGGKTCVSHPTVRRGRSRPNASPMPTKRTLAVGAREEANVKKSSHRHRR